jgi:hypothetical protein
MQAPGQSALKLVKQLKATESPGAGWGRCRGQIFYVLHAFQARQEAPALRWGQRRGSIARILSAKQNPCSSAVEAGATARGLRKRAIRNRLAQASLRGRAAATPVEGRRGGGGDPTGGALVIQGSRPEGR